MQHPCAHSGPVQAATVDASCLCEFTADAPLPFPLHTYTHSGRRLGITHTHTHTPPLACCVLALLLFVTSFTTMKLLKFVNSDAPHTLADVQLRNQRLWFPGKRGGAAATAAKSWSIDTASPTSLTGGYWLLDDNNNPICELTDVLVAVPETSAAGSSGGNNSGAAAASYAPRGVTDRDVDGIDFRSKMGRQLERERATYGAVSKTASKSARTMMNAEEVTEKKYERVKREREAVAEAIESNEVGVVEGRRKESKRAKK